MAVTSDQTFGKNLEVGFSFKNYSNDKISRVFSKYSTGVVCYKTTLEKKNYLFKVKLKVNLVNKIQFESIGKAKQANKALDLAVNNVSKRIRRYLRRIKKQRIGRNIKNLNKSFLLEAEAQY